MTLFLVCPLWATPDGLLVPDAELSACEERLFGRSGFSLNNRQITFNGGRSTRSYPLSTTLQNLGLHAAELTNIRGRVMLLGEGLGSLLPFLSGFDFAHLVAVDPIYTLSGSNLGDVGAPISQYVRRYRSNLIAASGDGLPLADGSMDQVWSHMLINNFFTRQEDGSFAFQEVGLQIMAEVFRALKIGGRAVLASKGTWALYDRTVIKILRQRSGTRGTFFIKKEEFTSIPYPGARPTAMVRLSITKVSDRAEPAEILVVR